MSGVYGAPWLRCLAVFMCVGLWWLAGAAGPVCAAETRAQSGVVRIGVLAYRSKAETAARWQPLANYLGRAVPSHAFAVVPLDNSELDAAIDHQEVDFVLAQPGHYVRMANLYGISSPLATVVQRAGAHALDRFGGVIFARANRADLRDLADIRGLRVAFAARDGLGGYQMQVFELARAGIQVEKDLVGLETGQPQDKVVAAVLAGTADLGFVRTGLLEDLAREGRLDLGRVQILGAKDQADFPYRISTALYPEWPFAAMPQADQALARRVTAALLMLPHDDEVARLTGISGFTIPGNYRPVDDLLRELRLPPYDRMPRFSFDDVWRRYGVQMALGAVLASLAFATIALKLRHANQALEVSEGKHRAVLSSLGEGVFGMDAAGRCTFANPAALAMLGLTEGELIGADQHALFHYRRPDGSLYPHEECPIYLTLHDGTSRRLEEAFLRADGSDFPVDMVVTPWLLPGGQRGAVVAFQDITERKAVQARLQKMSLVVAQSPESIVITDIGGTIEYVNETFERVTGYSCAEVVGRTPALLNSGRNPPETYADLWRTVLSGEVWRGQLVNRRKDGGEYTEHVVVAPLKDEGGAITHLVGVKQNITEWLRMEAEVARLEASDPLTGLANRDRLLKEIEALPATGAAALLLLNIDRFKVHNEGRGHQFGDALLRQVAARLRALCPAPARLARVGGDEFAVLLDPDPGMGDASSFAQRLQAGLRAPLAVGGDQVELTAGLGITVFTPGREAPLEILSQASIALEHAKSQGGGQAALFSEVMSAEARARFELERDLSRGLARGELRLYLQAQIRPQAGVAGAEALVRWQHPELGLLPPGRFIPVAESSDLIIAVEEWVLDQVCRLLAVPPLADADFRIAVNISPRHFRAESFVADLNAILGRWGVSPARLTLEITEGVFIDNMEDVIAKMESLSRAGFHLSIDDFGTGYSSLSYLKRLPIQELKIDKSFIQDAPVNHDDAALVETILAVAERLNLDVVAEGVETPEQARFLDGRGKVTLQGFLYGMPTEAGEWARDNFAPVQAAD